MQDFIRPIYEVKCEVTEITPTTLDLNKYGFLDTDIVTCSGSQMPLNIDLSDRCRKIYEEFARAKQMPANKFATQAAQIINDSMTYEFSIITNTYKSERRMAATTYYERAKQNYTPQQNATMRGICSDAGKFIRKIMLEKKPESPFGFSSGGIFTKLSDGDQLAHDVTLLYNNDRWVLINSLSPTNNDYVLRPENLKGKLLQYNDGLKNKIFTSFS